MSSYIKCTSDEWLYFNGLQRGLVLRLLQNVLHKKPWCAGGASPKRFLTIDGKDAWQTAADSFAAFLPAARPVVRRIRQNTPPCLVSQPNEPVAAFVRDRGKRSLPYVSLHYDKSPAALLGVAHEFAHAAQILASDHALMPPIAREVCAFLGEYALTDWFNEREPALSDALTAALHRDDLDYLGSDAEALNMAMSDQSAMYNYRWNYPVARLIASWIYRNWDQKQIWSLFCSGEEAVSRLDIQRAIEAGRLHNNWLPSFARTEAQTANLYQQLGALTLLDAAEREGAATEAIAERYACLSRYLRSGNVFIGLDNQRRPIGYIAWNAESEDGCVVLRAPFGDDGLLVKAFRHSLPELKVILDAERGADERCRRDE